MNSLFQLIFIQPFLITVIFTLNCTEPLHEATISEFNSSNMNVSNPKKSVDFTKMTEKREDVVAIMKIRMKKYKIMNDTLIHLRFKANDTMISYFGNFDTIPIIGTVFEKGELITHVKKPETKRKITVSLYSDKKFCWFKF